MNEVEINTFIERMEEIGDIWDKDDVKRVYCDMSLEDALDSRMGDMNAFGYTIGTILNRNEDK